MIMTTELSEMTLWDKCLNFLRDELPEQKFNTWLRPLQAEVSSNTLTLGKSRKIVRMGWAILLGARVAVAT